MKNKRILTLSAIALLGAAFASAQTADEIIAKYLTAIGGKEQINQISSVYMEGTLDVMGSQGTVKISQINGKGQKQEIDVMGTQVVMCVTDSTGWQINPMSGNYSAETMQENQYLASKDQIYVGGLFALDYASKGYTIELLGQETIGTVNAFKLKVVGPGSSETIYYFDPETYYLIRSSQKAEMMGQEMNIETNYSDYQKTESGLALPHGVETNYGGQFFLVSKINKVEVNQPMDPAIFAKP
jgi:hypothetical protein